MLKESQKGNSDNLSNTSYERSMKSSKEIRIIVFELYCEVFTKKVLEADSRWQEEESANIKIDRDCPS